MGAGLRSGSFAALRMTKERNEVIQGAGQGALLLLEDGLAALAEGASGSGIGE